MKKSLITIAIVLLSYSTQFAQTPQSFKYQAIARDNTGNIIANQDVSLRISILQDSASGSVVYSETHIAHTNDFGLLNIKIGNGTVISGNLTGIKWGNNIFFIKTEMDPTGGTSYSFMGTSQLLAVPYALYSEKTANVDDADHDPANELQSLSLSNNNLSISPGGNTIHLPNELPKGNLGHTLFNNGSDWVSSTNIFNNDGDVGIGTDNPGAKLEVYGTGDRYLRIKSSSNGTTGLELIRPGSGFYDYRIQDEGGTLRFYSDQNEFSSSSGNNIMSLTSDARLGIGTSTVNHKLSVYNSGNDCEVLIKSATDKPILMLDGQNGLGEIRFQKNNAYKGAFGYNYDNDNLFMYHGGNMVFKNGKLGIAVTNPSVRLHVLGDVKIEANSGSPKLMMDGSSGSPKMEFFNNGITKAEIGYDITNDYIFLNKNGNVTVQNGNVYADGNFKYSGGSKTYYKHIPAATFILTNNKDDDKIRWYGEYIGEANSSGSSADYIWSMIAPLNLPDGAEVIEFKVYSNLQYAAFIIVKLYCYEVPPTNLEHIMAECSGSAPPNGWFIPTDNTIQYQTIDNENNQYYIGITCQDYGTVSGNPTDCDFYGARIKYTMNQVNP